MATVIVLASRLVEVRSDFVALCELRLETSVRMVNNFYIGKGIISPGSKERTTPIAVFFSSIVVDLVIYFVTLYHYCPLKMDGVKN